MNNICICHVIDNILISMSPCKQDSCPKTVLANSSYLCVTNYKSISRAIGNIIITCAEQGHQMYVNLLTAA